MELVEVLSVVRRVDGVDPSCGDRAVLLAALSDVRRVSAWVQSREAALAGGLGQVSSFPEREIADISHTSIRDASRVLERADTLEAMPAFEAALTHGSLTGTHVDLAGRALRSLEPGLQPRLADAADRLVQAATVVGTDEFARLLRREVRRIEADDGMARLEQQRRNTRLRSWVDHDGMYHLAGCFDPVTGATLAGRLRTMLDTLFADTTPATAPTDPILGGMVALTAAHARPGDRRGVVVEVSLASESSVAPSVPRSRASSGKDHLGANCVVAAHLAERFWSVMHRGLPYVICDNDGHPVTPPQAKAIIAEQWAIQPEVRARRRSKKMGKAPQKVLEAHVKSDTRKVDKRGDLPHPPSSRPHTSNVKQRTA